MTRIASRTGLITGTLAIIVGLTAAVGFGAVAHAPAALAASTPAVEGTDVSNLTTENGTIDWADVRSAGMDFVGILAVDGATVVNADYASDVSGAFGQGLYVMPYVVADPLSGKEDTGADQFNAAWPTIESATPAYAPGGQYLPIVLDLEAQPAVTSSACYNLSQSQMQQWIASFVKTAQSTADVTPIIYADPSWWQTCVGSSNPFTKDPLWIADYGVSSPAIPAGWPSYTFWQETDTDTISGIPGGADLDLFQATPPVTTATLGSSGSVQLQTLNSLAGQSVTYSTASSLPAGVSLTSSGLLSWTSATPTGSYPITVTPADGASGAALVPSSVSLTLNVTIDFPGWPIVFHVGTTGLGQDAG